MRVPFSQISKSTLLKPGMRKVQITFHLIERVGGRKSKTYNLFFRNTILNIPSNVSPIHSLSKGPFTTQPPSSLTSNSLPDFSNLGSGDLSDQLKQGVHLPQEGKDVSLGYDQIGTVTESSVGRVTQTGDRVMRRVWYNVMNPLDIGI